MAIDPLGHLRIAVSDFARSRAFYTKLFSKLGFAQVSEKGWATPQGFGIWIIQAEHPEHRYMFEAPGLHHLCFKAATSEKIDELHLFLTEQQIPVVSPPKRYPQYTPEYYAVFFTDPDGIELEIAYY